MVDRCYMCKRNGESVDHLLLHCEVVYALWNAIFNRFGFSWIMSRVVNLFASWWTDGRSRSSTVWKMVPSCLL
jgi:hypothetical protein